MSGVEAIGIVLGGLPLLISAFEHWKDICEAKDLLIRFRRKHARCWNAIKDEEVAFRMHLEILLLPLAKNGALEEHEIEDLVTEAGGLGWKRQELESALKQRLGRAHVRYLEILEEIPPILRKLFEIIGCEDPDFQKKVSALQTTKANGSKASMILRANAQLLPLQIRFTVQKMTREELISDLHESIKKLERFLSMSVEIATLQERETMTLPRRSIKALLQYGKYADRLFVLMHRRWACACKHSHCAYVWLHHQVKTPFELALHMLYAPASSCSTPRPPWQDMGLRIVWCDKALNVSISPQLIVDESAPRGVSSSNTSANTITSLTPRPKNRSVRFSSSPSGPSTIQTQVSTISDTSASNSQIASFSATDSTATSVPQQDIRNLCKAFTEHKPIADRVGSLIDHELGDIYEIHSQPHTGTTADEISLHEVLILQNSTSSGLTRVKRFQLALKIASSHLRLRSTPWARTQWESKDIRFPLLPSSEISYDTPYISASFDDSSSTSNPSLTNPPSSPRAFSNLGIILLELLFKTTLEQHPLWLSFASSSSSSSSSSSVANFDRGPLRLMVARMWADEAEGEAGPDYSAVVAWCLNESPQKLEGEGWRRDLAEKVVGPLERCCAWIEGGS